MRLRSGLAPGADLERPCVRSALSLPTPARGRRRKGHGWWASHHRRGLPRPPRYGSSAPQAEQWRGGARIARRAIVADAATASRASALMRYPTGENPKNWRNSAVRTQSPGAVWRHRPRRMGYPTPVGRRTLGRVARATEHRDVRDVERRTACRQRDDVIDRQVGGLVGWATVACGFRLKPISRFGPIRSAVSEFSITR